MDQLRSLAASKVANKTVTEPLDKTPSSTEPADVSEPPSSQSNLPVSRSQRQDLPPFTPMESLGSTTQTTEV